LKEKDWREILPRPDEGRGSGKDWLLIKGQDSLLKGLGSQRGADTSKEEETDRKNPTV